VARPVDICIRLLAASIILLLTLNWAGVLDRAGEISITAIQPGRGHAYVVPRIEMRSGAQLPDWFYDLRSDSIGSLAASPLRLFEDARLIMALLMIVWAAMAAGLHWAREFPRVDKHQFSILQNIVRNDPDPYFRYVRLNSADLWPLEAEKRALRAFSLYFSNEFANSLLYLSPQHDLGELRPHWVRLADCDGLDPRALDLLGTKYVFCRRAALPTSVWEPVAAGQGQTLFRRRGYDGGIRLYCRWRAVGEELDSLARDAMLEAFSQRVALVSSEDAATMPVADADCPAEGQAIGKIDMVEDRPGRMVLNVTAPTGGILVIPDNYAPGWRASINGNEARALRIYRAYLGARIERGENSITFEFVDNWFWIGLTISLMTLTGLMIYLAISFAAGRSYITQNKTPP